MNADDSARPDDLPELPEDRRGALQLPPVSDLRRHPPANAVCRGVRLQLRDYLDGDLDRAALRGIDEHVHECRACALAMARLELEVVRIRKTLAAERAAAAVPPADLTAKIMRRVGDLVLAGDDGSDPDREVPADFTREVMQRVQGEWSRGVSLRWSESDPWWRRTARSVARPALAAAAVAVLAFGVARSFRSVAVDAADIEVVAARGATAWAADGTPRPLADGDTLQPGTAVSTEADGRLTVRWLPQAARPDAPTASAGPAIELALYGDAEARLGQAAALSLRRGAAAWEAAAGVALELRDIARIEAASGRYWASVEPVMRPDASRDTATAWRGRIEVLEGSARVVRGKVEQRVDAAQTARFEAVGPLRVEPATTLAMLRDSRSNSMLAQRPAAEQGVDRPDPVVAAERWSGRVVRADTGAVVANAQVTVRTTGDDQAEVVRTEPDGRFSFVLGAPQASGDDSARTVVLAAAPPRGSDDLAAVRSRVISLDGWRRGLRDIGEIALAVDQPVRGEVRGAQGAPLAGATIVPAVVDEVFGVVDRLERAASTVAHDGSFAVRGLPAELGRNESLLLMVEVDELPRVATALPSDPLTRTSLALDLQAPATQDWELPGRVPGAQHTILEEVPGLPLDVFAVKHEATAGADGTLRLRALAAGALFLVQDAGALIRLEPGDGNVLALGEPVAPQTGVGGELASRLRTVDAPVVWPGSRGERTAVVASAARGSRFARMYRPAPDARSQFVTLHDANRPVVPRTRLFVQYADGTVAFVGVQESGSVLRFRLPERRPFWLVAVGEDGSFGMAEVGPEASELPAVQIRAAGSVDLSQVGEVASGGAPGMCRFEPLDGVLGGRAFWRLLGGGAGRVASDLPPGEYRVTLPDGREWTCSVPAGAAARLENEDATGRGAERQR